ncbi:MAG: DUF1501 domain-containing protein [Gemmataceae bacterium]|nr:DUF1501 domain-containing protein [Gemmataceae bacterium]
MKTTACPSFFFDPAVNRREFLRAGALSLFGLGLPQMVQAQNNGRPKRAKACILLFMWGGPAQQDTWDMKPDAPADYRGEFRPIATTVPGLQICEHLPRLAQRAHQLSLIRSMTHNNVDHTKATHFLLTGKPPPVGAMSDDWPSYGAILSKLGRGHGPLPPFVSMMPVVPNGSPRFVEQSHGQGAGWLGPVYNPMRIDADASLPDYRVADFALSAELTPLRAGGRQQLLRTLDQQVRRLEAQAQLHAMQTHYERAFSLLAAPEVTRAFDLSQESPSLRERYGMNIHGQSVLQARRLVEAGVPIVTVFWPNDGITNVSVYWDTHNRNFIDLRERLCPVTDRAFSALLDDLDQRGMLDETLVVWTGEMGRTPRVGQSVVGGAGAGRDGRDHWGQVFTSVLAGGGVRGGAIHGSSDRYAAEPATNATQPADLAATIYQCLGVDPSMEIRDRLDRPVTLCDGQVITPLLR